MKIVLVIILSLITHQTLSNSPEYDNLTKKLSLLNDVQADFVQHTFDGKGTLLQTQKGVLNLKQPNKFRWESQQPYEQLLISNGDTLWQFDEDLEQVTLQKLNKKLSATPALLLSGDTNQIAIEYDIYSETLQDETHFVLIPKQSDVLFDRLRLEFDGKHLLHRMVIKDEVGQKTIIRFLNIQTEQNYPNSKFEFIIPSGIDVIRNQ
ncbi:outer membrane lipoprotein chaperone LolA [Oceaniserpentilla sp. 4NH20-0058]|uniref:outer membrane lipoprotein chaperone LolA n=1 Tax=Oceaniserpentilla sp. 4NH20-0058 TaxID=3127660 RepID=UPI0031073733